MEVIFHNGNEYKYDKIIRYIVLDACNSCNRSSYIFQAVNLGKCNRSFKLDGIGRDINDCINVFKGERKMRKIGIFFAIFLSMGVALAQPQNIENNAGILPDSQWYKLDLLAEKINLFFNFNPIDKAIVKLQYVKERIEEQKEMIKRGKPEFVIVA